MERNGNLNRTNAPKFEVDIPTRIEKITEYENMNKINGFSNNNLKNRRGPVIIR